jgi:hypothetical protein
LKCWNGATRAITFSHLILLLLFSSPSLPFSFGITEGVSLDRGYVSDEDTSIYNPGLTLLTESEKERLVEAVIDARKVGLAQNQWSENNEFAFDFLREKLDPFHLVELSGFWKVMPLYAGMLYLGVLAVQQIARDSFQVAYLAGVALFFLPIVALIAAGV